MSVESTRKQARAEADLLLRLQERELETKKELLGVLDIELPERKTKATVVVSEAKLRHILERLIEAM